MDTQIRVSMRDIRTSFWEQFRRRTISGILWQVRLHRRLPVWPHLKILYNIIGWGFCDIRNNQGRGKCYQPKTHNTKQRPWLFRISQKSNLIIILIYIVLKKITTSSRANALSHRTQFIFDKPRSYVNLTLLLEIMHCARNLRIIY